MIAPKRVGQSERPAFKATNSEQAEFKMHTVTPCFTKSRVFKITFSLHSVLNQGLLFFSDISASVSRFF